MKDNSDDTMIMQTQQSTACGDSVRVEIVNPADTSADSYQHTDADQLAENQYRAGAYSMLAALLRMPPPQDVLNVVTGLADGVEEKDDFAVAMSMLGLAARTARPAELDDEFHALFIGLGRGELVPYGSWYLTGFLMEKPLGVLRDDLSSMGFARNDSTCEPEDHVAALCEVMAMLIDEGRSLGEQTLFFNAHMSPWLGRFFTDLSEAKSAVFYRAVARFGKAYFDFEKQYLAMRV
jgi:TorA maturation chaperone TorD